MNKKRKGGLSLGGIVLIILLIYFLKYLGPIISLILGAAFLAALFFIIRAIIKAFKSENTTARHPADVKTHGTYPRPEPQPRAEFKTSEKKKKSKPVKEIKEVPYSPKPKEEPEYTPEIKALIDEGTKAHSELEHLYQTIPNLTIKSKIRELIDISDKITMDAVDDPSDAPQIRKFQDYYLPTTIKLLNAYDRMGAQGIQGENITSSMQNIEEMLDTAVEAYRKLLDSLFANQALDVETDIQVMNTLLKREGLAGEASAFDTMKKEN